MRYLKNTDLRFHLVEAQSRWFLWLAAAGFAGVLAFVIWKQEFFRPVKRIEMLASGSQGVQRGMAVRLSGFRIGKVNEVDLLAEGRVRVRVDLFREYGRFVRRDAVAAMASESLLGDRFIEISGGHPDSQELEENGTLPLAPEKSLNTMMESLRDEIRPAVIDAREMIAYLNDPEGDFKVTLRQVREVSRTLEATLPGILAESRRTAEQGSAFFNLLGREDGELRRTLTGLETLVTAMNEDMPRLMEELHMGAEKIRMAAEGAGQLMADAGEVVKGVDEVVRQSAPEVPKLIKRGAETMRKADDVVTAVKGMWPLRRGVPKEGGEELLRAEP